MCIRDRFNGWGNKFDAELDNQITKNLHEQNAYNAPQISSINYILEGGSIESDGQGTLLTTKKCLLNSNRNSNYSQADIESLLNKHLGSRNVLWLGSGDLVGDDTDAHIDTLARFAPNNRLIFQGCQNTEDEHFLELDKMKNRLSEFKNSQGLSYDLYELPFPDAIFELEENGKQQRLPASYANFLFINNAVLLPIYNVPQDILALEIMKSALPGYKIIPIDCTLLIRQYGSLHCITMQIPTSTRHI